MDRTPIASSKDRSVADASEILGEGEYGLLAIARVLALLLAVETDDDLAVAWLRADDVAAMLRSAGKGPKERALATFHGLGFPRFYRNAVCWIGLVCTVFFCFKPDWTGSFSNMYWIESD